jgi:hypothetical protein
MCVCGGGAMSNEYMKLICSGTIETEAWIEQHDTSGNDISEYHCKRHTEIINHQRCPETVEGKAGLVLNKNSVAFSPQASYTD